MLVVASRLNPSMITPSSVVKRPVLGDGMTPTVAVLGTRGVETDGVVACVFAAAAVLVIDRSTTGEEMDMEDWGSFVGEAGDKGGDATSRWPLRREGKRPCASFCDDGEG